MIKVARMKGWLLVLVALMAGCSTTQSPPAPEPAVVLQGHCGVGCPTGIPGQVIDRDAYTLSNNGRTKFADWVAYRITQETYASGCKRRWATDPDIPATQTLAPEDYKDAYKLLGLDRGHQANLASMCAVKDWQALNYLSNITPQKSNLNQGAWERLENQERALREDPEANGVHVLTGPLYERTMVTLPHSAKDHAIPSGYWKVIFIGSSPEQGLYASFVMDQDTPRGADFCTLQVTIDEIEKRSGLTLWTGLPAQVQAALKSRPGQLAKRLGCVTEPS